MATIKRRADRNGRWQATVRVDGRERTKTFDRKVDADRWVAQTQADVSRGTWVDPAAGRVTVKDYAAEWFRRMEPTWRSSTVIVKRNSIDRHVMPVLGERSLASLRKADIEAMCASLGLGANSVATVHQHLSQMLAAAVEDGLIARNPATRARLPKREPSKAQPVALEVVDKIAAALPERLAILVPLGVGCGLRVSEATGLTVDRIDFLRRTLRVDRQLVGRGDAAVLGPPKTASSHRTIPLAPFVVDALAEHLRRFKSEPGEILVRDDRGRTLDRGRFGWEWRPAVKAAGAAGLGYHSLRHTFASTLLSRGVSVKAVADWLGHSSPAITLNTYAHLMPRDEDVARTVLEEALNPDRAESPADQARTAGPTQRR